jgi:hypothetical protein
MSDRGIFERIKSIEAQVQKEIDWCYSHPSEAYAKYGVADRRSAANFIDRYSPTATLRHQAEQIAEELVGDEFDYSIHELLSGRVVIYLLAK